METTVIVIGVCLLFILVVVYNKFCPLMTKRPKEKSKHYGVDDNPTRFVNKKGLTSRIRNRLNAGKT